jgi:hypothetical protein
MTIWFISDHPAIPALAACTAVLSRALVQFK